MKENQPVRIAVSGILGRVGSRVAELAQSRSDFSLKCGVVREIVHQPATADIVFLTEGPAEAMEEADVLIEFTNPEATLEHLEKIKDMKRAAVVGTTGLDTPQLERLKAVAMLMPVVMDSNFSLGLALMRKALDSVKNFLGDDFDCGILDIHRKGKKDAPSGTAKDLAEGLAAATGDQPGVLSLRMGEVPGEHNVYFASPYEMLEFNHRVYSRDAFAAGALHAALWVKGRAPGLYRFTDTLGHDEHFQTSQEA